MAEAILSFGVQKLWDLLVREPERFHGVDEQFTELKSYLNLLRSFLKDADAKKHTNATVRNCMEEIKEIVYDAEDIIETFLLKEEPQKTSGIRKHVKRLAFIIVDRRQLASDMGGISKRISKVIYDMQSFGIQQLIVDSGDSQPLEERNREMRQTFSSENEIDLVGLENNVKSLVRYLVEEDNIQVVSIIGMGGIGKTTLARQVFNHEMIKHHFDGLVWVCVSQQFTRKYVWQMILRRLSPNHDEHRELEMMEDELQDKLFRLLEAHNPLIVLDDMWKEEDWDRIKPVFPPKKGWKVLLTSRNEGVAFHAHKNCVSFKPECLTPEDSWTLFQRIAFPRKDKTDCKIDEEMEEIGRHMIKHCGGLPLAIKVLGGLLAAQYTLREWKRLYVNIGSQIVGGTSFNNSNSSLVYHVLSLSYEELPVYLKHCFLYLAHFPEDYDIDVWKLSNYWAAEGIPRPRYYDGATIRDVAEAYIEELVKRNMVISERDITTSRFKTCHLHDMMREVCLLKAEEENFLQIVDARTCFPTARSQSTCTSRRLVINCPVTYYAERRVKNPKLRSLLFFWFLKNDWTASGLCFTELKLLRVLDLFRAEFQGGKLPSSVGNLIHLRYLSLEEANTSHLPSSLRNLKLLLYLNLSVHTESVYVPNVLKEMQELRYLALPVKMHEKTKLKLADLVNLETLKSFSTKHVNVRDLQGMTRLETLSILFNGGCGVETLSSSLGELRRLENLTLHDDRVDICIADGGEFVLDCIHLNQLNLSLYMQRLPDERHFPSHLTYISLSLCMLEEDPMPILEKLLLLKRVNFGKRAFAKKRMVCSGTGFPQLQELVLSGLEEWEEWIVEEGSMPLLRTLSVGGCKKLKGLPDGLEYLTSLKELKFGVMTVEFQERLEEGGEDYYKFQHIPLVQFFYFG